eukprot:1149669-Pelagomonas_calceolata.AAC.4
MQYAVVNTGLALAGKSLAPDGNKEHQGWVLLVFLSVFAGFGFWAFRQSRRESNRYKVRPMCGDACPGHALKDECLAVWRCLTSTNA